MAEERILLDVQLKTSDAIGNIEKLKVDISKLTNEQKALTKQYESGLISSKAFSDATGKLGTQIRLLQEDKKNLEITVKNEIKNATALEGSYDKLSSQYNLNKQKLNEMSVAERAGTEAGKALEQETFNIYQEMIKLQEATGKHVLSVGDYTKVIEPLIEGLKKENVILEQNNAQLQQQSKSIGFLADKYGSYDAGISAVNAELQVNNQKIEQNNKIIASSANNVQNLTNKQQTLVQSTVSAGNTIAGMKARLQELEKTLQTADVGSKVFKKTNDEAQKLKLKIEQVQGRVNGFGEKEPKNLVKKGISDTTEAAAGLVSMIQLVNLVSGENEEIAKVQAKAMKALAISQLAINAAKSTDAIMGVKELAQKGLLIVKEKLYASAIDQTTGKLKLARVAMISTGIGALVVGLTLLITNFKDVSKWVQRFTNGIKDWVAEISGGNKVLMSLANIITTIGSPLIFVIKLINDFSGTLSSLQNSVNGITSQLGFFGKILDATLVPFNLFLNALKSLDTGAKKYKVDLADLEKQYGSFSEQIDRNNNKLQQQIDIVKSQGKNEKEVASLTRQMLQQTTAERQKALDRAIEISNKLIKQNGKLTDDQQKLFDKVQDDFNQASTDQVIFENELRKEANAKAKERYNERIEIERNLQHELIQLRNGFIKDEFDKQRADLQEQFRVDKEANDLLIKENIKKFGEKSKIVQDLREKETLLTQKFNDDLFAIDVAQADREVDVLIKKNETEAQIRRESYVQQVTDLENLASIERDIANATFVNSGKTKEQIKNQEIQHNNDLLAIELKFVQAKLELSKKFASEDGIISPEEVKNLNELAAAIGLIQEKIKEGENSKLIDGLGLSQKDLSKIQEGANAVLQILDTIRSVVDANAANQIRAIDDAYKYEENAIQNSTASQEEKEAKIQALNKKTAEKKYAIELEQFEANKAMAIITATIQTALAVMNAFATTPFPASIATAILAGLTGAVQIGIIASQPPPPKPSFKGGVIGIAGAGHGTSDNINAKISAGESVLTAAATRKFAPVLAQMEMSVGNTPNYQFTGRFAGGLIGDGGMSNRSIADPVNSGFTLSTQISTEISKQLKNIKVITKVTDINNVQGEVLNNRVTSRI